MKYLFYAFFCCVIFISFSGCFLYNDSLVYEVIATANAGKVRITYTNSFGGDSIAETMVDSSSSSIWTMNIQPSSSVRYRVMVETETGNPGYEVRIYHNGVQKASVSGNGDLATSFTLE